MDRIEKEKEVRDELVKALEAKGIKNYVNPETLGIEFSLKGLIGEEFDDIWGTIISDEIAFRAGKKTK